MSDIPADADPHQTKLKGAETTTEVESEEQTHVPPIGSEPAQ
ncbi:MAG TPA: hypothetical protein VE442_04905 [Jatrophihabitans sp.]|nr:hypothetical protein [Jatrophihabitans sp.]